MGNQQQRSRRSRPRQQKSTEPPAAATPVLRLPTDLTELRRQWALRAIQRHEEQYEKTRNPVLAWRAYLECRGAKLAFPDWVLEYFDRPAMIFWHWSMSGRVGARNLDAEIVAALEMRRQPKRKGRGNVFDDVFPDKRSMELACGVYHGVRIDGKKLYMAIQDQVKPGVSRTKVQRAWDRHKEMFRQMEVDIFPEAKRTEILSSHK